MKQKTNVVAEDNRQELVVTREFELPVEWLFKAYVEPQIIAQWMGTEVIKLDNRRHGSYQFETTDPYGNKHRFNGTIHNLIPNRTIIRTFEMEQTPYPVQLEFLEFESLTAGTSMLTMKMVFKSVADRDNILKLPFGQGINMAHNRLQQVVNKLI